MNPDLWPALAVGGAFGGISLAFVVLIVKSMRVAELHVVHELLKEDE